MGRQGIDLRDARHGGHKRGTDRSAGADQIAVLDRFPYQLLGNNVHDRIAIADNGVELPFQPFLHNGGKGIPVHTVCLVIADLPQGLIAVRDDRGALVRPDRGQDFDHIRDPAGIVDDHIPGLAGAQIGEFLQHLIRRMEIQGGRILFLVHAHAVLNDSPVNLVLRIHEVNVSCRHHRLVEFLAQTDDLAVQVQYILHGLDLRVTFSGFFLQQEGIVASGLNLQIVIEFHDLRDPFRRPLLQDRLEQFAGHTGTAHQDALPVFDQLALGNPGLFKEIFEVGITDHPVQVDLARIILGQQDTVIGVQTLDQFRIAVTEGIDILIAFNLPVLQHLRFLKEDTRRTFRVVDRTVMEAQIYIQLFGHRVQGIPGVAGQEDSGDLLRIDGGKIRLQPLLTGVLINEADIETDIVADQDKAPAEFQEPGQDLFDRVGVDDHIVTDAGQLGDPVGDRYLRIDKF